MSINIMSKIKSNSIKIYSLKLKDRQVIDVEFDELHRKEKMK